MREILDFWDWKSMFLTIAFIAVGAVGYYYLSNIRDRFRTGDEEKYKGQTKGAIISVEKVERITQSKWLGTRIFVDRYKVSYGYEVNGDKFESVDLISVTPKNRRLLKRILESGLDSACFVRYNIGEPNKSLLIEHE